MKQIQYSITINAPKEKVWHTMLIKEPYQEWTKAFNEGSTYEGTWEQGSKIYFLGPDPTTGKVSGMVSRIAENREYGFISIEHLGLYQDGVEDTTSEEATKWAPAYENYTFIEKDGATEVVVDIEVNNEYAEEFNVMWPKALEALKAIAER